MSIDAVTERLSGLEAALARLTVRLREVSSVDEIGDACEAAVLEVTGATHVFIRLAEPDGGLRLIHGGLTDASVADVLRLEPSEPMVRSLLEEGVPIWNLPAREFVARVVRGAAATVWSGVLADHSICFLVLNAASEALGTIGVVRDAPFNSDERWYLFAVAAMVSQVLERLGALDRERDARFEVEAARARLAFLGEMTDSLVPMLEGAGDDPWIVLRGFANLATPRLADACIVRAVEPHRLSQVAMAGPEELIGPLRSILSNRRFPAIFDRLAGREVVITEDMTVGTVAAHAGETFADRAWPILSRVRSIAHVPVCIEGRLVAVVSLVTGRELSNRSFSLLAHGDFFSEVGRRLSLFVENADRFARGRRLAEMFQRTLLPDLLPWIPGIDAASRYLPASSEDEIGGDWFDLMELADGRIVAAVGDVVGSGLEAAASMGEFRTALRALSLEGRGPGSLLERVSELAAGFGRSFATAFVAVIDPYRGEIRYAAAGHPPAAIVHPGGEVAFLDAAASAPLAVEGGIAYAESLVAMAPGDSLVLYTDGLVERRGEPLDRGLAALNEVLGRPWPSASSLVTTVVDELVGQGERMDDVAVLVVRLTADFRRFQRSLPAASGSIAHFRDSLRDWLRAEGVAASDVDDLVLAVSEATSNAVEHAGTDLGESVHVIAEVRGDEVVLTVRDQGAWRPPSVRPERGRGLSILREVSDSLEVRRRRGGTEIKMHRRLGVR